MATPDRDDRGAVMVEFALIVPILVTLFVGIVQFGLAWNTSISIESAAREGARAAALGNDGTVDAVVRDAAPSVEIDNVALTQACVDGEDGEARVTVTEDFTFGIPFVPLGTRTLTATGVMRCGV